ncbi:MAG: hypothetical protein Q9162_003325 [Coniocarpon cinnabarinum]
MKMTGVTYTPTTYAGGGAAGEDATDTIHFDKLDLPDKTFRVMNQVTGGIQIYGGIMGLGPQGGDSPAWKMLSPQVSPQVVGIRMQNPVWPSVSQDSTVVGQVDWGAPDDKYVQQGITYADNVGTDGTWTVNVAGASVNGKDLGLAGNQQGFIDTGTPGIGFTDGDIKKVMDALGGGLQKGKQTDYQLPCDLGSSTFEISIGNTKLKVPNSLLISKPTSNPKANPPSPDPLTL